MEKSRNNSKSLFRNNLQKLSPIKSVNIHPDIPIYIVYAMRVVRIIPVANLKPPTLNNITSLPGDIIHIVFDIYPDEVDFSRPSKGRYDDIGQHRYISSQQILPSSA